MDFVFLSFFLYVLTSVEDIRRASVYKCKGGAGRGVGWIKEVNSYEIVYKWKGKVNMS